MSWLKRMLGGKIESSPPISAPRAPDKPTLAVLETAHQQWTPVRIAAYEELFGCRAKTVFPSPELITCESDPPIDVIVYELSTEKYGDIDVAVTNGMSNQRTVDRQDPNYCGRREIIQYVPRCTPGHAKRLRDMAWAPFSDEFFLDYFHTVSWKNAAVPGTPYTSAFFMHPLIRSHDQFTVEVDGETTSLLWHIPITDEEREYKARHGTDALIDRLQAVNLPRVFDEENRPSLLP